MNHEESKLQRQCVAWFRAQYPQYAMLLTHPINEGSGHTTTDRRRQGIHKAEGAVAHVEIEEARKQREKEHFLKVIGKK